jgi:hypothetical protein
MKIRPVGAELFHADRRTGRQAGRHDEADSRFPQFCERAYTLLTLYRKKIAVSCKNRTELANTLCRQHAENVMLNRGFRTVGLTTLLCDVNFRKFVL